jgi:peptidoglycan/LPS O-acetylase OafA/YrhL
MIRTYRKDIDGLRAIAVTTVIGFHAQWTALPGGFVGVDVFFVISGFLIGAMIIDDVTAGKFSLLGFYERRIRRIFPALAAMLLAATFFAYLYLLPVEFKSYARSLLAATFSFSNFYFAQSAGYFMPAASTLPLLHTWSLAIEEQFYLFLPLFVLLVYRFRRRALWPVLLAVTLISLALSVRSGLEGGQSTDFYMPQLRAWELLLGVLLAWRRLPLLPRLWREGAALLGLTLIIIAATLYVDWMPFPGYAALMPCLGAALVIGAGKGGSSWTARALSLPPVVFIGRISYSLYLWHWPIFIFMRLSERFPADRATTATKLLAIAATTVIATLSWKYIETPFRSGPWRPPRRKLFAMAGAAAGALAAIALGTVLLQGLPGRFSPEALKTAALMNYDSRSNNYFRAGACFLDRDDKLSFLEANGCLKRDESKENYLLIGDSYAAHYWYGLATVFDRVNFMQATAAGCTPLPGRRFSRICNELLDFLFKDHLLHHKPDKLIVSAEWLGSDFWPIVGLLDWAASHDIHVILLGPIMRYDDRLPRLLSFAIEDHDPNLPDEHRINYGNFDQDLRRAAQQKGATYVSLFDLLCKEGHCTTFAAPGVPLQFDDGHLTREGSVYAAERMRAANAFGLDPAKVK